MSTKRQGAIAIWTSSRIWFLYSTIDKLTINDNGRLHSAMISQIGKKSSPARVACLHSLDSTPRCCSVDIHALRPIGVALRLPQTSVDAIAGGALVRSATIGYYRIRGAVSKEQSSAIHGGQSCPLTRDAPRPFPGSDITIQRFDQWTVTGVKNISPISG